MSTFKWTNPLKLPGELTFRKLAPVCFNIFCPMHPIQCLPNQWQSIRIKPSAVHYSISESHASSPSSVFVSVNSWQTKITQLHWLPSATVSQSESCGWAHWEIPLCLFSPLHDVKYPFFSLCMMKCMLCINIICNAVQFIFNFKG